MIEAIFFGVAGLGVLAAIVAREVVRRRVTASQIVEARVVQRRLIVTALVVGLAVMSGLFAAMAASLEAWPGALVASLVCAALVSSLVLTRKPIAVVRYDTERRELTVIGRISARVDLSQPFTLSTTVKMPLLNRGHPWTLVALEQGNTSVAFCFPWDVRLIGIRPSGDTSEPLPTLILDWRGAVIFERLHKLNA